MIAPEKRVTVVLIRLFKPQRGRVKLLALVVRLLLSVVAWLSATAVLRAQAEYDVQDVYLNARIDGRIFRLEAQITKPKGAEGRLPVALLLHGKTCSAPPWATSGLRSARARRAISPTGLVGGLFSPAVASDDRTGRFP